MFFIQIKKIICIFLNLFENGKKGELNIYIFLNIKISTWSWYQIRQAGNKVGIFLSELKLLLEERNSKRDKGEYGNVVG